MRTVYKFKLICDHSKLALRSNRLHLFIRGLKETLWFLLHIIPCWKCFFLFVFPIMWKNVLMTVFGAVYKRMICGGEWWTQKVAKTGRIRWSAHVAGSSNTEDDLCSREKKLIATPESRHRDSEKHFHGVLYQIQYVIHEDISIWYHLIHTNNWSSEPLSILLILLAKTPQQIVLRPTHFPKMGPPNWHANDPVIVGSLAQTMDPRRY